MSFEDWYHPDKDDPNGRSPTRAGAEAGMAIGSLFGPAGAGIGTIIGGFAGAVFGSSGARRRARRRATNSSYAFAEELFRYAGEVTTNVTTQYDRDESSLRAAYAASGGEANESFRLQRGKLRQNRDRELGTLADEVANFREGENYEWFIQDYERVTGVRSMNRSGGKDGDPSGSMRLGGPNDSRGSRDLPNPYNDRLRSQMRATGFSWDGQVPHGRRQFFNDYVSRVQPSVAMYERLVFGGTEGRREYMAYMENRIAEANKWYDQRSAVLDAEDERRRRQQERDDQRGAK